MGGGEEREAEEQLLLPGSIVQESFQPVDLRICHFSRGP